MLNTISLNKPLPIIIEIFFSRHYYALSRKETLNLFLIFITFLPKSSVCVFCFFWKSSFWKKIRKKVPAHPNFSHFPKTNFECNFGRNFLSFPSKKSLKSHTMQYFLQQSHHNFLVCSHTKKISEQNVQSLFPLSFFEAKSPPFFFSKSECASEAQMV